jgi:hypothetical protein
MKMTDCYYETKDWRACKKEVRLSPLYRCISLTKTADGGIPRMLETKRQRTKDRDERRLRS